MAGWSPDARCRPSARTSPRSSTEAKEGDHNDVLHLDGYADNQRRVDCATIPGVSIGFLGKEADDYSGRRIGGTAQSRRLVPTGHDTLVLPVPATGPGIDRHVHLLSDDHVLGLFDLRLGRIQQR